MVVARQTVSVLMILAMGTIIIGCGSQTPTAKPPSVLHTSTPTATITPAPTVQPTADLARCFKQQASQANVTQAGDVLIAQPVAPQGYPAVQLPDQTQLKPVQVPVQNSNNVFRSGLSPDAKPANPGSLNGSTRQVGFEVDVCNGAVSQAHVVQSFSVRIATLTPYSGQISVWPSCDGAFSRLHPTPSSGGCGGGFASDEQLQATFASGTTEGTTVVATQTGFSPTSPDAALGPLPAKLAPGKTMTTLVVVNIPEVAGTYAIAFGVAVDSAAPVYTTPATAFLIAPVAHTFTGSACTVPSMAAQIPAATTPETYYICPA